MTTFESIMFLLGAALAAIIFLALLIPTCVGAVQFWIHYAQIFKTNRATQKVARDMAQKHQPD